MDSSMRMTLMTEVERVLKRDKLFGALHHLETLDDDELILSWDDAALRPKSKAHPGPYLNFMEEIADCLADFGYCLEADIDANEREHNNYLLIVADEGAAWDE